MVTTWSASANAASTSPHSQTPGVGQVPAALLVQHGGAVLERLAGVDDDVERLVLDDDELCGVARELARLGDDRRDRLADVAHLADRERVVLHLPARVGGDLEERVGEDRDLVAGQRPVHTGERERRADVDRLDPGVRVGRAHEVEVAHPVALDVVEEEALALRQASILAAGDALPDEALLEGRRLGRLDGRHAPAFPAATTASTMFQYPVQRQMFPCSATLTSSSLGLGFSARSALALISIPGVQ